MATKKTASAKKTAKSAPAKQTKTKVTTVKAVAADATPKVAASSRSASSSRGRTVLLGAILAEFIGTFILAAVAVLSQGQPLFVGFALIAIVLTIGTLSGSHVNPLITVGAWATRKISGLRALGYIIAQVLGALLAFVVVSAYVNAAPQVSQQAQMLGQQAAQLFTANPIPQGKEFYIFFGEMLGALLFGFAVSSAVREKRNRAAQALTVGLGLFVAVTIAGVLASYVGGSAVVNPAIAFTVQAVAFSKFELWGVLAYLVAPLIGGTIGFFLYDVLRSDTGGDNEEIM